MNVFQSEAADIAKAVWPNLTDSQRLIITTTEVFPREILLELDAWGDGTLEAAFREVGRLEVEHNGSKQATKNRVQRAGTQKQARQNGLHAHTRGKLGGGKKSH